MKEPTFSVEPILDMVGKQAIIDTHVEGITDFLKRISSDHHLRNSPTI